jgi:hypothetical protein
MKRFLAISTFLVGFAGSWWLTLSWSQADHLVRFESWTTFTTEGEWLDGETSLKGGELTTPRQAHEYATSLGLSAIEAEDLSALVTEQKLVPLVDTDSVDIDEQVSGPYAPPLVRLFVERLGQQFAAQGCGRLIVTSALRFPETQSSLGNGSRWSVHPHGLAVDFRIPPEDQCETWLSDTLLSVEASRRVDATRERNPPHFHVVVVPGTYGLFVQDRMTDDEKRTFVESVLAGVE